MEVGIPVERLRKCPPPKRGCIYQDCEGDVYLVVKDDSDDLVAVCLQTNSTYSDVIELSDVSDGDFVWNPAYGMVRQITDAVTIKSKDDE